MLDGGTRARSARVDGVAPLSPRPERPGADGELTMSGKAAVIIGALTASAPGWWPVPRAGLVGGGQRTHDQVGCAVGAARADRRCRCHRAAGHGSGPRILPYPCRGSLRARRSRPERDHGHSILHEARRAGRGTSLTRYGKRSRRQPRGDSAARTPAADPRVNPAITGSRCTGKKQLLAWGYP